MKPMADGVGVTGGGFDGVSLAVFRRLLGSGVAGGGGMSSASSATVSPFCAREATATWPGVLLFRGRFFVATTGASGVTLVEVRAERRSDMVYRK